MTEATIESEDKGQRAVQSIEVGGRLLLGGGALEVLPRPHLP